ncbi:SEL1-like repeat protein [Vibrio vulnificus]|nr:SEL1-like repeat protein [Vibrio vulnificus]MCU8168224.1 SEL1-like repeat protein [Vibrio vulnificus]MCU8172775.1 SEL1-like repeat protein [Vibrio vulnificus]MCU8269170.1 SEL1-like repeat protein [Vibrio vulnificus]RZP95304.1 hypothetical protein D8T54_14095 [Vibrio vulnificus]
MKSAKQNVPEAMLRVAQMYSTGVGVEKNTKEAFKWLKRYKDSSGKG